MEKMNARIKNKTKEYIKEAGLIPKLFTIIKKEGYTKEKLTKDLLAGIIVGIIALPLSIALAIASGVSPEKGLFTAIVAGFIISFLGGSRVQIGGPTGAFIVIVYGIVEKYGVNGLTIATIMAGIFLILMGLFKMGTIIKFIPYPITTGFTSGIAIAILSTQIKDFFGLTIASVPSEFVEKMESIITNFNTINFQAFGIGMVSLMILIFWPKIDKKVPASIIAIVVSVILVMVFKMNVDTIGSRYNDIAASLPMPTLPEFDFKTVRALISPAFTIAVLAGIESLLSAVVADGMIRSKHRSNMELIAQGAGNIGSAIFGGIPATGAIARTAANIKNGGQTPIAGIVHSITVFLIMIILMPYAKLIPMPTLAAILVLVAYNMGDWKEFKALKMAPKSDAAVFLVTFSLTVFVDLVVAIEIGMVLAAFLFMKRMADVTNIKYLEAEEDENFVDIDGAVLPYKKAILDKILIYEINGPFFFAAADKFLDITAQMHEKYKVLVLRMGKVPAMDATGYHALEMILDMCKSRGMTVIFSKVQEQPYHLMEKYRFIEKVGKENFFENIDIAISRAVDITKKD